MAAYRHIFNCINLMQGLFENNSGGKCSASCHDVMIQTSTLSIFHFFTATWYNRVCQQKRAPCVNRNNLRNSYSAGKTNILVGSLLGIK